MDVLQNTKRENYELVDRLRLDAGALEEDGWTDIATCMREAATRITELEVELDRLIAALLAIPTDFKGAIDYEALSLGEALAYRSEDHGPRKKGDPT